MKRWLRFMFYAELIGEAIGYLLHRYAREELS